ncbi:MAG: hypothetical protein GY948_14520 [Alphaproteobacteria bacterium]|nr:hypothetical protein [Alphaproteobacteria bacterium]
MILGRRARAALVLCTLSLSTGAAAQSPQQSRAQQALAGQFVRHAVAYCGYEASRRGETLSATEFGEEYARDRQFADGLWHGTFACKEAYIGASCMAARWALCQRTFAEYGPDGALLPGLLKPIIHK